MPRQKLPSPQEMQRFVQDWLPASMSRVPRNWTRRSLACDLSRPLILAVVLIALLVVQAGQAVRFTAG